MKKSSLFLIACLICFAISPAMVFSQTKADTNGKTTIIIKTKNNKTLPVYQIPLANSTGTKAIKQFGDAPSKYDIENGNYRFRVGHDSFLDPKFSVNANGGTQVWEVSEGSLALQFLGWALFAPGITIGTLVLSTGADMFGPFYIYYGAAAAGAVSWYFSFGSAELVEQSKSASNAHISDFNLNNKNELSCITEFDEAFRRDVMVYNKYTYRF